MFQARMLGKINTGHQDGPGDTGPTPTGGHSPNPYGGTQWPGTYQPPQGPYSPPPPTQGPVVYPPPTTMPDPLPPSPGGPQLPPDVGGVTTPVSPGTTVTVGPGPIAIDPTTGYPIAGYSVPMWVWGLGLGVVGVIIGAILVSRRSAA